MNLGIPPDLELRPDITQDHVVEQLDRHANLLIYGRPARGRDDEAGEPTVFRSVVIVGGVVALDSDGEVRPMAVGAFLADDSPHARATLPKLAEKLRKIAGDLELLHARKLAELEQKRWQV